MKPIDAVIAVTYLCNSRCIMCSIWQKKDPPTLKAEQYLKLPSSLRDINISGGEPFLRPDLLEIIKNIIKACPKARLVFSSNGFATDLILKKTKEILKIKPDIGVSISIDGVGEKHNEVRRIADGFNKAMKTIDGLKKLGVKNLKIGFTAGDYNIDHLLKVYDLARKLKVEFTLAAVHSSEHYFGVGINKVTNIVEFEHQLQDLINLELATWNFKRWLRAYFSYGLFYFVKTGKRILPDYTGYSSFFLDPDGFVFSSDVSNYQMGNIQEFENFKKLLNSPQAKEALKKKQSNHWMICTARTAMRKHLFRVAWWVLKNKLCVFFKSTNSIT